MSFKYQPENQDRAEAELMDCLLADTNYPWDYTDPTAADYYETTDSYFSLDDWSNDEIASRSASFFAKIESCWQDTPATAAAPSPLAALTAKFGTRVPQQWLAQIATNVSNIANSNLEPVDRLVQSVGDLLSNWATDDLLVMARPYAYAMRCNPGVDNPDNVARPVEWEELSEVERAKLTILIAQYAIDEINS